jgi:hypothetical protein
MGKINLYVVFSKNSLKILVCDENKVVPVRKRPRLKHSIRMGSGMSSPAIQCIIIPILNY